MSAVAQNVGPKDPNASYDPGPDYVNPQQSRGDNEKSWGEVGGYAGEALGKGLVEIGSGGLLSGPNGGEAAGKLGHFIGEAVGGALGAAADRAEASHPQPTDWGTDSEVSGAGMSSPSGTCVDADSQSPGLSESNPAATGHEFDGGMSSPEPNASVDPQQSHDLMADHW